MRGKAALDVRGFAAGRVGVLFRARKRTRLRIGAQRCCARREGKKSRVFREPRTQAYAVTHRCAALLR